MGIVYIDLKSEVLTRILFALADGTFSKFILKSEPVMTSKIRLPM